MTAKTRTPPNISEMNPGFMKKLPMISPAITVDTKDRATRDMELLAPFSRMFPYPMSSDAMSKKMHATVNPKKWKAPGLRVKLSRVAMSPMKDVAPGFRVHHKVMIRREVPIMSHRIGSWVSCQNMGEISQLIIAQIEEQRAMAAISRALKYGN